jgi:hypothetical protein
MSESELKELAAKINDAFGRALCLARESFNHLETASVAAKEVGDYLYEVKCKLPHGEFQNWVSENCNFHYSTAARYMKISKDWNLISRNWNELKQTLLSESKKEAQCDILFNPLSLRKALSLASAKPKTEGNPQVSNGNNTQTRLVVNSPGHPLHGQNVKFIEDRGNDIVICESPDNSKQPFMKSELVKELPPDGMVNQSHNPSHDNEIIDVDFEDIDTLREAIALLLEYLLEPQLQLIFAQALTLGKELIPSEAQEEAIALAGYQAKALAAA